MSPGANLGEPCNEMRCALIRQPSEQKCFCRPRERRSIRLVHPGFAHARPAGEVVRTCFMIFAFS